MVEAAALNFLDILLCQGQYQAKPPLPFTPGTEIAGTVEAVGEGIALMKGAGVGPAVLALGRIGRMGCRAGGLCQSDLRIPRLEWGSGDVYHVRILRSASMCENSARGRAVGPCPENSRMIRMIRI